MRSIRHQPPASTALGLATVRGHLAHLRVFLEVTLAHSARWSSLSLMTLSDRYETDSIAVGEYDSDLASELLCWSMYVNMARRNGADPLRVLRVSAELLPVR